MADHFAGLRGPAHVFRPKEDLGMDLYNIYCPQLNAAKCICVAWRSTLQELVSSFEQNKHMGQESQRGGV